jgi:hypothetical protein
LPIALRAAGFLTAIDGYTGNYGSIWDGAVKGLATYWSTSASVYRAQNFEFDMYRAAKLAGWRQAAIVFYRAVVKCSRQAGNSEMEARDRFGLAGLLHEDGDSRAELAELEAAERLIGGMDRRSDVVDNLDWESRLRKAEALVATNPVEALHGLEGIEENRKRTLAQQMRLWQARGLARAALSDAEGARKAFGEAIALNQDQVKSIRTWVDRMPVLEAAAPSYRGLTQLELMSAGGVEDVARLPVRRRRRRRDHDYDGGAAARNRDLEIRRRRHSGAVGEGAGARGSANVRDAAAVVCVPAVG